MGIAHIEGYLWGLSEVASANTAIVFEAAAEDGEMLTLNMYGVRLVAVIYSQSFLILPSCALWPHCV